MYGGTPAMAMQPPMPSTDPQRSSGPFDGGYEMPSGFGMYTMGGDSDNDNDDTNAFGTTNTGAGTFRGQATLSSASLYNVPSYYQAGSYGGFPQGGTYRVQGSRRVSAAVQVSPAVTTTTAAAAAAAGGSTRQRSGYNGMGSSFDYDDNSDFYGGDRGVGVSGGAEQLGSHVRDVDHNGSNLASAVRSGATTATSISDCHLSRKDDGGFTPRTNNTFLQSHGSLGAGSVDSRGSGGVGVDGGVGSVYEGVYFTTSASGHSSEPALSAPPQRRLSDTPLRRETPASHSSSSTISTATAQHDQHNSGNNLSARLSRSDHVVPLLASSPMPRAIPRQAVVSASQNTTSTGSRSSVQHHLRKSNSFHRPSGNAEDVVCAPVYDMEPANSPTTTPRTPPAAPSSAASTSTSPRKLHVNGLAAPTKQAAGSEEKTAVKPNTSATTEIPFLPSVPNKSPTRVTASSSTPRAAFDSVGIPHPAAARATTTQDPPPPVAPGKEWKARTHVEEVDKTSSHSGGSANRTPRTPPSRKAAKERTSPPGKHTGTVLPSTTTTTTTVPITALPATAALAEAPQMHNDSSTTRRRRVSNPVTSTSTSNSALAAPSDSRDTTLSSLSPVQLSRTMGVSTVEQQQQQQQASAAQPPPQPPSQALMAFTVAPPPTEAKDPNRFFRRRYLQPPVSPLSAVEVSKPVAPSGTKSDTAASTKATAAPLTAATARLPTAKAGRNGASLLSNASPVAVNNLVGSGGGGRSAASTANNSPHVNTTAATAGAAALTATSTTSGVGTGKPRPPSSAAARRRAPSGASSSIVPTANGTDAARDAVQANSAPHRHRSGSETHSLHDIAGTTQTRSCPSMELSMDEGTNPYLQRRSSSWSGHSTVCSSDSGEGSHASSVRAKRHQDRMLPSVEEEMERYSLARFGVRF